MATVIERARVCSACERFAERLHDAGRRQSVRVAGRHHGIGARLVENPVPTMASSSASSASRFA